VNATGSYVTPSYWGDANECDIDPVPWCQDIWSTAHGYAYWTSTLRCGYYTCNWYETPLQVEELLYDPGLQIHACCAPLTSIRTIDLMDDNGNVTYSKIWIPTGSLCWQSTYDPNNYDHFGGCNTSSYSLIYWGSSPGGYGRVHLGINSDTCCGWGYTSGWFRLY
jgi:hypothetical protein